MNKIYNFEAIFNLFLIPRKLSRKVQKSHLVFFRSFLNWLSYSLQFHLIDLTISAFLPCLSPKTLDKYQKFLQECKISKTSIYQRIEILERFREFLENHPDLPIGKTTNTSHLMESALLSDFISEMEDKGCSSGTLRSYKSDIGQFLKFIRSINTAQ